MKEKSAFREIEGLDDALEELLKHIVRKEPMEVRKPEKEGTICNTLRQIYYSTKDPEIRLLVLKASIQAKKMAKRLLEYRKESSPE